MTTVFYTLSRTEHRSIKTANYNCKYSESASVGRNLKNILHEIKDVVLKFSFLVGYTVFKMKNYSYL